MKLRSLKFVALGACVTSIFPTLSSCKEDNRDITRIDFTNKNYQMIFLGQQNSDSKPRLYGLLTHADVLPIDEFYKGSDGQEHTETCAPLFIKDISDRYFFFVYQEGPRSNGSLNNYLVDKNSGECFPFPNNIYPVFDISETRKFNSARKTLNFPCDKNDNMYCVCEQINDNGQTYRPLYKIDFSNPNHIIAQKVSDENDSITGSFGIDADGDIAYSYKDTSGNWAYKFVSANGDVTSTGVIPEGATSVEIWTNTSKEINFICNASGEELNIYKINFSNNIPEKVLYKNFRDSASAITGAYCGFEGYKGADTFKAIASMKTSAFTPSCVVALTNDNRIVCLYSEQKLPNVELWEFELKNIFDLETEPKSLHNFCGGDYNFLTIGKEVTSPGLRTRSKVAIPIIPKGPRVPLTTSASFPDTSSEEAKDEGCHLDKAYSCVFDDDCLKDTQSYSEGSHYVLAASKDDNNNDILVLISYQPTYAPFGLVEVNFKSKIECINDMPGIWKW